MFGAPIIEPPLAQDVTKRTPDIFEGEAVDTELVVPRLSEYERQRIEEAKSVSAEALGKAATEIRAQHDRTLAELISSIPSSTCLLPNRQPRVTLRVILAMWA